MKRFSKVLFVTILAFAAINANAAENRKATTITGAKTKETPAPLTITKETFEKAARYSREHEGFAVLVVSDGKVLFEDYAPGRTQDTPAELASGTKSFWGVVAVAAQEDGLLKLDEKVSDTITEWKTDPEKSKITIHQLLTLTSGLPGGSIGVPPVYAEAVNTDLAAKPGKSFQYGPVPFQVFGELLKRKLAASSQTPVGYLETRILAPLHMKVGDWRKGKDGNFQMPSGARVSPREWAKFGEFIVRGGVADGKQIIAAKDLKACFEGTKVNPSYGLTFWLNALDMEDRFPALVTGNGLEGMVSQKIVSSPMYIAAGLGKQRLYMIPDQKLVVVRQGKLAGKSFRDDNFLSLLFHGKMVAEEKEIPKSADQNTSIPGTRANAGSVTPGPMFKRMDKNGDGRLSADEIPERMKKLNLDKNGDGAVTWDEMRAGRRVDGGRQRRREK
ncbi:serine hydrolase [Candidatus Sumerlaeota bacterium]|nr:serine hydrolase [Candidatus Sumerlaeota bacterium]